MLDIQNMSGEYKLHNFISGMQGWAQKKLQRQNVKDLRSAIGAADSFIDFRTTRPLTDVPPLQTLRKKMRRKGKGKRTVVRTIQMTKEKHK